MKFSLAMALGLIGSVAYAQGPPPATVLVDPVRLEVLEQRRSVSGELRSVRESLLASEEEGLVVEFAVREGDHVNAGDIIARLDSERAQLAVEIAKAQFKAAEARQNAREAEHDRAQRDLRRKLELAAKSSASESEVDDAETAFAAAEARLREAMADVINQGAVLQLAHRRLDDMTIRAPFDGRITARETEVGEWIGVGAPIAQLLEVARVEAWVNVPDRFLANVRRPDTQVEIRFTSLGTSKIAPVTQIIPKVDPISSLFPLRIVFDNDDGSLAPGMDVIALIPTGQSAPVKTINRDAVLRDDAGEFVYFVGGAPDAPIALIARIKTLFAAGDRLVVESSSLQPGMRLVTEGTDRLFQTQPLIIQNPTPQSGTPAAKQGDAASNQSTQESGS